MTLMDEYRLSLYTPLADLQPGVSFVQSKEDRQVYIKKVLTVYNPEIFLSLKAEPVSGLPTILEVLPDGKQLILIEEYICGKTLAVLLQEHYFQTEDSIVRFMLQLSSIVRQLHDRSPSIIHRDIKPDNIILAADGRVRLLDMDAAKQYVPGQKQDTVLIGTEGYAAPEQYGFGASSVQTDIYALGILFREILSDLDTFSRKSQAIIVRCTQLDPKARYENIAELMADLSSVCSAIPTDGIYRENRFLPPGFRTGNPMHIVLAVIGYALLFTAGWFLPFPQKVRTLGLLVNYAYGITAVLFNCNYLGIWNSLRLTRFRSPFSTAFAVLGIDAGYTLLLLFLAFLIGRV